MQRYRKDSKAATMSAAREEEKRIRDRIARTGSPFEPIADETSENEPTPHPTFSTVVEDYLTTYAPSALKIPRAFDRANPQSHLAPKVW